MHTNMLYTQHIVGIVMWQLLLWITVVAVWPARASGVVCDVCAKQCHMYTMEELC